MSVISRIYKGEGNEQKQHKKTICARTWKDFVIDFNWWFKYNDDGNTVNDRLNEWQLIYLIDNKW